MPSTGSHKKMTWDQRSGDRRGLILRPVSARFLSSGASGENMLSYLLSAFAGLVVRGFKLPWFLFYLEGVFFFP